MVGQRRELVEREREGGDPSDDAERYEEQSEHQRPRWGGSTAPPGIARHWRIMACSNRRLGGGVR